MLFSARGLGKRFGALTALADLDLDVEPGSIVGLLGENGAGKSTLLNLIGGALAPDAGTMTLAGRPFAPGSPRAAAAAGIGVVHQHFALVGRLTAAENLALAMDLPWRIDRRALRTGITTLARRAGLAIDELDAPVADLPVGVQQRVEILKALARPPRLLLLDEPTAVLAPQEVEGFLAIVRELRRAGVACVFIDHKIEEVMAVADRVVVLRAGRKVLEAPAGSVTSTELARAIVGGEVAPPRRPEAPAERRPVLTLRSVATAPTPGRRPLDGVDLELCAGEVLGIAGVAGNGQEALCEVLGGLVLPARGTIAPAASRGHHGPAGGAIVPGDRRAQGLVPELSVDDNLLLAPSLLRAATRGPMLDRSVAAGWRQALVAGHGLKLPSPSAPVATLSGGNQQKVVVGRALTVRPRWLAAFNPTRGLDVGATASVQADLLRFVTAGGALLLVSTDLDEVLALSHRVQVLDRGRLSRTFAPPFDHDARTAIGLAMAGDRDR